MNLEIDFSLYKQINFHKDNENTINKIISNKVNSYKEYSKKIQEPLM